MSADTGEGNLQDLGRRLAKQAGLSSSEFTKEDVQAQMDNIDPKDVWAKHAIEWALLCVEMLGIESPEIRVPTIEEVLPIMMDCLEIERDIRKKACRQNEQERMKKFQDIIRSIEQENAH